MKILELHRDKLGYLNGISAGSAKLFELVQRLAGGRLCLQMVEPAVSSGLSLLRSKERPLVDRVGSEPSFRPEEQR
jgi:hypothetical protein